MNYKFSPHGDTAIVIEFGDDATPEVFNRIQTINAHFAQHKLSAFIECVPAFTSLTVFYEPARLGDSFDHFSHESNSPTNVYEALCSLLEEAISSASPNEAMPHSRSVQIPVCYGDEFGLDLEFVARHTGFTTDEVIEMHASAEYRVRMIGFAPGFPYLEGLPPHLATPRRARPRSFVHAGSVGIGGAQTGIYSLDSPGGWQLIGRTPIPLFRPHTDAPSLLCVNDKVTFRIISREDFDQLAAEPKVAIHTFA